MSQTCLACGLTFSDRYTFHPPKAAAGVRICYDCWQVVVRILHFWPNRVQKVADDLALTAANLGLQPTPDD